MNRLVHQEARRGPDVAVGEPGHGDEWLGRIEVGLAVLVYRLIPALIIARQTAGAAAVIWRPGHPRWRGQRQICRCRTPSPR